jgi:hypothetical protein
MHIFSHPSMRHVLYMGKITSQLIMNNNINIRANGYIYFDQKMRGGWFVSI